MGFDRRQNGLVFGDGGLLPCTNGAFGNLDWREAATLTQLVAPRVAMPTHFWMLVEHHGDTGKFLKHCAELAPLCR